jgi:hypothetical protein
MAIVLKVKWVDLADQPDPYQRIRHIGGSSGKFEWKHTPAQAIDGMDQGQFIYFVEKDARALKLEVGLAPNGSKFLKTQTDGIPLESLFELPKNPRPELP